MLPFVLSQGNQLPTAMGAALHENVQGSKASRARQHAGLWCKYQRCINAADSGVLNRAGVANAGLHVGKSPAAVGGAGRAAQHKDLVILQCLAGLGLAEGALAGSPPQPVPFPTEWFAKRGRASDKGPLWVQGCAHCSPVACAVPTTLNTSKGDMVVVTFTHAQQSMQLKVASRFG